MYFDDLSPRYKIVPNWVSSNMLSVGWLAKEHKFKQGDVAVEFTKKLLLFCERPENLMRGYHVCDLCPINKSDEHPSMLFVLKPDGEKLHLGNGEVYVKGNGGKIYSAPTLIYHYIMEHKYLPPQEFIDAVCLCDLDWKAHEPKEKSLWQRLTGFLSRKQGV